MATEHMGAFVEPINGSAIHGTQRNFWALNFSQGSCGSKPKVRLLMPRGPLMPQHAISHSAEPAWPLLSQAAALLRHIRWPSEPIANRRKRYFPGGPRKTHLPCTGRDAFSQAARMMKRSYARYRGFKPVIRLNLTYLEPKTSSEVQPRTKLFWSSPLAERLILKYIRNLINFYRFFFFFFKLLFIYIK